jgi:endonuclease YncB( thermonuclease family)
MLFTGEMVAFVMNITSYSCMILIIKTRNSATPLPSPASGFGYRGIDAPELQQTCTAYGQSWACGRTSAEWLRERLNGLQVECVGHARDRYQRLLAVCYVGGEDQNERIVREGWALAYRRYSADYVQPEAEAKRAGAGIWRGEFTPPWEWRAERH